MFEPVIHQVEISGPQMEQMRALPEGVTTIGRQETNDLVFIHPLVSRKHAELVVSADTCKLMDLGSTHGTQLNRETIAPETAVSLNPGDVIEIGAFRLLYQRTNVSGAQPEAEASPVADVVDEEVIEETAVVPPPPAPIPETTQPKPTPAPKPKPQPISPVQSWKTASYAPLSSGGGRGGANNGRPTANGHQEPFELPPGQSKEYSRYLEYLPEIYRNPGETFMPRFLALLESILAPVEWTGDNFDLFLDARTAPEDFLPWLANWYELTFDSTWSETAKRTVLLEAHLIYRRRGTAWGLQRLLQIYTGAKVQIEDQNENLENFTFSVRIAASAKAINRAAVEQLINANKPAHTSYDLIFTE